MTRLNLIVGAAALVLFPSVSLAQPDDASAGRGWSLRDRIAALRQGWGSESEETPAPVVGGETVAEASVVPIPSSPNGPTAPSLGARTASAGAKLPRINERNLLPSELPSGARPNTNPVKPATPRPAAAPATTPTARQAAASGSAQSRLYREMRQQSPAIQPNKSATPKPSATANALAAVDADQDPQSPTALRRRAQPRAGSVLSTESDWLTGGVPATAPRQGADVESMRKALVEAPAPTNEQATLSRSIAAEVAAQMSAPSATVESPAEPVVQEAAPAITAAQTNGTPAAAATSVTVDQQSNVDEQPKPVQAQNGWAASDKLEVDVPSSGPRSVGLDVLQTRPTNGEGATVDRTVAPATVVDSETILPLMIGAPTPSPTPAATPQPVASVAPTADSAQRSSADGRPLLMSHQMPAIQSRVAGPQRIVVGREARFRVTLENSGAAAAQDLVAAVSVPTWAEVVTITPSQGAMDPSTTTPAGTLSWRMSALQAGAEATLDITLIARAGKPIELGVHWTHAPVGSAATVVVEEPKLAMSVTGPEEVLFGRSQQYRLTLSNPGTGAAENVRVHLLPPGQGDGAVSSHVFGDLPAGTSRSVEIELTAREAGQLYVKASADAAGGLTAECTKPLRCVKPELQVDWRGPQQCYAGASGAYYFRVHNAGTAPAEGTTFTVELPPGFEPTAANDGRRFDAANRRLAWNVGTLLPGDDFYLQVTGAANTPGANTMQYAAETADGLAAAKKTADVAVVAIADIRLEVFDPKGPLPLGEEVVYQIKVKNRGQIAAESVRVAALFSRGIEPISAEGARFAIADGRVAFDPIASLPAGGELVLTVRAKPQEPGTHVFRAEAQCSDQEFKLAAEETTRFYRADSVANGSSAAADRFSQPR